MATSTDDGKLRHLNARNCCDHLRSVLGDAAFFKLSTYHETCDIVQEDERNVALATDLNKVCSLESRLTEKHAIVAKDANWISFYMGEAAHKRTTESRLELM